MRLLLSLFLFASLALTGCAVLLIQPDDSRATTAAKVAARVPMAVATIGVSEIADACARGDWPETEGITRGSPAALAARLRACPARSGGAGAGGSLRGTPALGLPVVLCRFLRAVIHYVPLRKPPALAPFCHRRCPDRRSRQRLDLARSRCGAP